MPSKDVWTRFIHSYDQIFCNWDPYQELIAKAKHHLKSCQVVLDQGCGTGLFSIALASSGKKVFGIDANESMLQKAHMNLAEQEHKYPGISQQVSLILGNALHLPFDDAYFDGVVLNNVISFVIDPIQLLAEAYRVIRPGGKLFISGLRHIPNHDYFYEQTICEFKHKGIYEAMKTNLDSFLSCCNTLKNTLRPIVYTPQEIKKLLLQQGFSRLLAFDTHVFLEQHFLAVALK